MGRGRAKAKQVKVARQLKYSGGGMDLDQLRAEFGVGTDRRESGDHSAHADYADRYSVDDDEDEDPDEDDLDDLDLEDDDLEDDDLDDDLADDEFGDEDFDSGNEFGDEDDFGSGDDPADGYRGGQDKGAGSRMSRAPRA